MEPLHTIETMVRIRWKLGPNGWSITEMRLESNEPWEHEVNELNETEMWMKGYSGSSI